jgi:beta-lactamase regulating signal transducer with metallopeptidase domain
MFEAIIHILNRAGTTVAASLVNTAAVALCGVAAAAVISRSKGWSAATRYSLWWLILAFVVAAPFISAVLPENQTTPAQKTAVTTPRASAVQASVVFSQTEQSLPVVRPATRLSAAGILLLCWLLAAATQAVRLLYSLIYGFQLKRHSEPANDRVEHLFHRLSAASLIRRPASLSISRQICSPAAIGYLRPRVLIPADLATHLSDRELEQILLHELVHIKRYDDWHIAAQRLVETVGVLHPLVRFLAHQLDRDREMACDDCVAAVYEPKPYAACLAKVAEASHFPAANAVLVPLLERKSELLSRVEILLDKTRTHVPRISVQRLLLASAGFLLLGALGLRAPRLMAFPAHESPAPQATNSAMPLKNGLHSITVTTEDGHSSTFGGWSSDDDNHEPGTIQFRSDGKTYLIRDKSVLAQARQIVQPMEELGRKQSALGERQAKLGEAQAKLGEQQREIAERQLDASTKATLDQKLRELRAAMDKLASKQSGETASEAQAMLGELQARLAEMQAEMGSEQGKAGQEQGLLGDEQGKLGEQQGELGRQQGKLGAQQAIEAKRVEKKLEDLIRDAQSRGLAQPLN